MACERSSGEEAEWPMGVLRQRGRNLSEEEARRLRDMILALLIRVMGLSVPDAQTVCMLGSSITRDRVYKRLRKCPLSQRDVVRRIRSLLGGGEIHAG